MPIQPFDDLRRYQSDVLLALLRGAQEHRGETFTVMFPRQSGKNEVSAALVASLLQGHSGRGGSIVVCAPTLHPQAAISFERTVRHLRAAAAAFKLRFEQDSNTLRLGEASAVFLSGSPTANVAGHTASILLIGDEAQDLEEEWFDRQFRPMAASTGAATALFGTPWQGDSLLEKAADRNRLRDANWVGDLKRFVPRHHQVSWERVTKHLESYGRFIEQERERLGADHPIFLSQYELRPAASERRLLNATQLWSVEGAFGPLPGPRSGERYVAGLDFAGEGAHGDATVLTIARIVDGAAEVVHVRAWRGQPFDFVLGEVSALARRWRLERLVCDATGLGAPLASGLVKELGARVQPFSFTGPSKSGLAFELLAAVSTGTLRIAPPLTPAFQALWDELRACEVHPAHGGQLRWGAPAGLHDDCVVSLALCLHAANEVGPARVAVGRVR